MLSKQDRINTERFREIIENGKNVRSSVIFTKFLPNKDNSRFAVSVPKKVIKGAIERHLLKRRIMASLRRKKDVFPNGDYIVFATEHIIGSRGAVLDTIIEDLAGKVASE